MPPNVTSRRGCRYWLKLLTFGVLAGLTIGYVGYVILSAEMMLQPAHASLHGVTPADRGLTYEDVSLTTSDGLALRGWYLPSRNGAALILLHGYGGNRVEMLNRAVMLAKHGYGVLMYDERASGESDGDRRTFGWLDVNDVPVALSYLHTRSDIDPQRIGILGFSIGGQIALRAATQSDQITAVIAEEPGYARISDVPDIPTLEDKFYVVAYWLSENWLALRMGVSIPEGVLPALPRIAPRPILFIATGQDYGRTLVKYFFDRAGEPKRWWEVPEAAHGGGPLARPTEYETTIIDFLERAWPK